MFPEAHPARLLDLDVPDWKKTRLAPYLELFKEFVRRSNSAALKDRRADRESSAMDF
jgi:hypothetical protein